MTGKRITLFAGHYGSGKTNLALNYARALKASSGDRTPRVVVADLDIVNPYFRTKDSAADLQAEGIDLVVSDFANSNVDFPALPKEIYALVAPAEHSEQSNNRTIKSIRNWMAKYVKVVGPSLYELPLDQQLTNPEVILKERYATRLDYIRTLCALLRGGQRHIDALVEAVPESTGDVIAALTMLELEGRVRQLPGKMYTNT